jgi:hypothetical protein
MKIFGIEFHEVCPIHFKYHIPLHTQGELNTMILTFILTIIMMYFAPKVCRKLSKFKKYIRNTLKNLKNKK